MSATVQFLRTFNRWRRGDENLEQPCPRVVGEMIDAVCDEVEALQKETRRLVETLAAKTRCRDEGGGVKDTVETPETLEAIERWHQGKVNIFDEMARLETERNEARLQYRSTLALAEALANTQIKLKKERDQARALLEASK